MIEILIKPETIMLCSGELEAFLSENGFSVEYKKVVDGWDDLSIALYKKSDKVTRKQLELQNIARRQMMGEVSSKAEIWGLISNTNDLETEIYERLTKLKREFRDKKWKKGLAFHIEYEGEFSIYHFTYFHVPDPEMSVIENERLLWGKYIDEMGAV